MSLPIWTDRELTDLAVPTPKDVAQAVVLWENNCPDYRWRGVLQATSPQDTEDEDELLSVAPALIGIVFWWYALDRTYARVAASKGASKVLAVLSPTSGKVLLDLMIDSNEAVRGLSDALLSGKLSLAEWRLKMAVEIERQHIVSYAMSRGGVNFLTPDDYLRIGSRVKWQLSKLDKFAQEIRSGKQAFNGTIRRRAQMYLESSRGTYFDGVRQMAVARGANVKRRILGIADHCKCCEEQASIGWVTIGSKRLKEIGGCTCLTSCKCEEQFGIMVGNTVRVL